MNKQKAKTTSRLAPKIVRPKAAITGNSNDKRKNLILIFVAVVVTAIVYAASLGNAWVTKWDDGGYVLSYTNPLGNLIHKLSFANIKAIFSVFYMGNYHPLTTLVYALEYSLAGDSPFLYHLLNLLIHLANIILVYTLLKLLTKRMEIAFIAALLFGIHPMHVESVAWISELKDVMYCFFFLGAMIYYYRYITLKSGGNRYYIISLLTFLLSALSKSAAVTLPVVLLLMDYYVKRKWQWKLLIEKIPFFIISFIFGIVAIYSQKSAGAIQDIEHLFAWYEQPLFACYAAMIYVIKLFVPIHLSSLYPYPDRIAGYLPLVYYAAPLVMLILAYLVFYSRKYGRDIIFGCLFFIITISLVLQLVPVGGAIIAERYSYIPYIGLFMIIGRIYVFSQEGLLKFARIIKWIVPGLLIAGSIIFMVLTFQRTKIWKDEEALMNDLINKYPHLAFAYNKQGYLYSDFTKNHDQALADYNKCIELDSTYYCAYCNRGVIYFNFYGPGKSDSLHLELALMDFTTALRLKGNNTDALIGRANTYSNLKKYRESLPDYDKYIAFVPNDAKAYLWRGIALYETGKYNEAMTDVNKSLVSSANDNSYLWRGIIYSQLKEYNKAIEDYNQSLKLNPNQAEPYNWRGFAKYNLKQYKEAIVDYDIYLKSNPKEPTAYINRSSAYFELKNYKEAFKDYCSAGDLRYPLDKEHFFKLKALAGK